MTAFVSKIDTGSEAFAENRRDMLALVGELHALKDRAVQLSEKRRPRFEERGQLTPRERLERLLDPGMPFLELFGLADYMVDSEDRGTSIPGASTIAGIGFINGARCMIFVNDSGINAGASTPMSGEKYRGCQEIALRQKLPFVQLIESAGANLMKYKVEGWAKSGASFRNLAWLSAAGIPVIAVLHGPSTAGGAYYPGMSDYIIGVKGRGRASLGGAALVKAATGEVADDEDLAGVDMHASVSGLIEYVAEDDSDALLQARDLITRLGWNDKCPKPEPRSFREPLYDPDEIAGVVPVDYRRPYDVREVVARFADGSDFVDFKPNFGASLVCMQGSVFGHPCGIVGNNGPIDPDGAAKGGHFFQICDQANIPLIFLNNITGYMVGTDYEQRGMIKHGSKMIQAAANVRVPKLTFYIGASFGAGNYGMAGLGYNPDFLFAWPNATTGVMGGEQAARTMDQVARGSAERRGEAVDEDKLREQKDRIIKYFDDQSDAFYTSGRMLDQGVIDPRDTRKVLGFTLETCWEARHRDVHPNSFGVSRL